MPKFAFRKRLPPPDAAAIKQCTKHKYIWLCWMHEIPGFMKTWGDPWGWKVLPVRVCPLCIKLARLTLRKILVNGPYQTRPRSE